jgi:site-specific recombinase XerC
LIDEEEVTTDPTRNLPAPKVWKTVPKSLSQADLEAMVASLGNSPLKPLVKDSAFTDSTGKRMS